MAFRSESACINISVKALAAEQRKRKRGLLVRLCEHRGCRLLDDLLSDESGDIDVGDARFGILVGVGSGRCVVS